MALKSGKVTSCSTPSPLVRVTFTRSPTFALSVGFCTPSMPPPTPKKAICPSRISVISVYSTVLPVVSPPELDEVSSLALPPQAESRTEITISRLNSLNILFIGYSFCYFPSSDALLISSIKVSSESWYVVATSFRVQNCCMKQPTHFVLCFINTENVCGHLCSTLSTVNWRSIIFASMSPKIPDCEKSLFALAQITKTKSTQFACFRQFGLTILVRSATGPLPRRSEPAHADSGSQPVRGPLPPARVAPSLPAPG